jgi:hypothetical protein
MIGIDVGGPPVKLMPAAAQTVGMAVRELAANAGLFSVTPVQCESSGMSSCAAIVTGF